jgi:hypothetical protein
MNSQFSRAEDTAALLLQGERSGLPVMIPGAFERRASTSARPPVSGNGQPPTDHAYAVAVSDRERLVYEREGGGAPSERSGGRAGTILERLWRSLLHRSQVPEAP